MIHVVAAAVTRQDGQVLIAQRPPGKQLAGGWEFPGGKLEAGETRAAGLARELKEELGIAIRDPRPLVRIGHRYPFGEVLIDMWVVSRYDGAPRGLDGQALQWCRRGALDAAALLLSDRPIIRALRIPDKVHTRSSPDFEILDSLGRAPAASAAVASDSSDIESVLRGIRCSTPAEAILAAKTPGADFLVMCQPLPHAHLERLCESVPLPVFATGLLLESAWALGATGISLLEPQNR